MSDKLLTARLAVALAALLPAATIAAAQTTRPASTAPTTTQPAMTTPATSQAGTTKPTTQPEIPADAIPAADSFRAIDRPDDDGSGILVEWTKPKAVPEGISYVIQVAHSEADFQAGKFKSQVVRPTPMLLGTSKPEYFGRGPGAKQTYFVDVTPSKLFPPARSESLTTEKLKELYSRKELTASELARAQAALEHRQEASKQTTAPGALKAKPTPDQLATESWFGRLENYVRKRDAEKLQDKLLAVDAEPCFFRLGVRLGGQTVLVSDGKPVIVEATAKPNLFNFAKVNNLVLSLVFCFTVILFIQIAKRKPNIFIRKIAGLEAIDEAIGRSTEMDRPVMFVHGGGSVGAMPVIASLNILSRIAYRAAEHDTRIRVMNQDALVTAVSQEAVQQACTEAGRPDAFNADDVSLVASDQFSYVAAVSGIMVRERPGAIFMLGAFGAESLLLSETGSATGAIQVAGTDSYTQLPFFITTCDYTLMGEELYAASAYLSREPRMLGSLRGQDVGKAFVMIVLLVGTIVLTVVAAVGGNWQWLRGLLEAMG